VRVRWKSDCSRCVDVDVYFLETMRVHLCCVFSDRSTRMMKCLVAKTGRCHDIACRLSILTFCDENSSFSSRFGLLGSMLVWPSHSPHPHFRSRREAPICSKIHSPRKVLSIQKLKAPSHALNLFFRALVMFGQEDACAREACRLRHFIAHRERTNERSGEAAHEKRTPCRLQGNATLRGLGKGEISIHG
jgi:hypothetical protein